MKLKAKKALVPIMSLFLLMFFSVYAMSLTGYYESIDNKTNTLTSEAIKKFEKDVLNGEKIVASNYIREQKEYDNLLSRLGIKIGNFIEKIFKKIMHFILKEIEGAID